MSKHFHGKPCKNCGGTLRYVNHPTKACVACMRARYTPVELLEPEDRSLLVALRKSYGVSLYDLAAKFEINLSSVKRNLIVGMES